MLSTPPEIYLFTVFVCKDFASFKKTQFINQTKTLYGPWP